MGLHKYTAILVCAIALSACQNDDELSQDAKKIDYSSQGITEVLSDFSGFSELEEVDYSNNDIAVIKPDAFKENLKLKYINLSGNKNLNFPENGPFLTSTAGVLNVSNCNIEKLPGNALDEMKYLEVLDLSANPIIFEESLAFEVMVNPPKRLIVSEITKAGLSYVCHKLDMTVVVQKESGREFECKDVRKGKELNFKNNEISSNEDHDVEMNIIEEGLMKDDTHMEMMMSDQGEGSGDEITETAASNEDETTKESNNEVTSDEAKEDIDTGNVSPAENIEVPAVIVDEIANEDEIIPDTEGPDEAKTEEEEEEHHSEEKPVVPIRSKSRSKVQPKIETVPDEQEGDENTTLVEIIAPEHNQTSPSNNIKAAADPELGETVEAPTSATSSIVLVLIIAVVVVGSALVGFKYWKNSKPTYSVVNGMANENPTEGKELKEIITLKPESQPLMEPRSDIQFEEVNEKDGKMDETKETPNEQSENNKEDSIRPEDAPKNDATPQDAPAEDVK